MTQRLNLSQIETAILQVMGYSSSTTAPWASSANLYLRINDYGQRLPMRLNGIARSMGLAVPVRFDCWRTSANSSTSGTSVPVVAAGSSTVYLPVNYDHYISFYDLTHNRPIRVIQDADRWHVKYVRAPAGPPAVIEIGGFTTDGSSNWRRTATLYPAVPSGVTPSIRMQYWRLPTAMPGVSPSTEYPDIDPKYEALFVYGPICDLARNTGFEYDRYAAWEKEMLIDMVSTSRSM